MKKKNENEVKLLFSKNGCELLDKYTSYRAQMRYKCKCGNIGHISLDKFQRRLNRNEGCWYCNRHQWTKEEDDIIRQYYGKETREVILSKLPGVTYTMLKNRANHLNLLGNRSLVQKKAKRKYQFDLKFFDKMDEVKSYWAGFILANSSICNDTKNISLKFRKEDQKHVEKFQDSILHTGLAVEKKKIFVLNFFSADQWLENLNLDIIKNLNDKNSLSFIVGYLDGDVNFRSKGILDDSSIRIIGNEELLIWIKNLFDKMCPSLKKKYCDIKQDKKERFYYLIAGSRAKYLIKKMLSLNIPKLNRKWDCYLNY